MKENNIQTLFGHWVKANKKMTAAWELKIEKGNRFNLGKIAWHQIKSLKETNDDILYYKLPDLGTQNPYDCITLYKEPAFLGIIFYKPRKKKIMYFLNINTVIGLKDDGYKSITEEEASKFADFKGELK